MSDLRDLEFDPDEFRHHLRGEGLTAAQEDELLAALWMISVEFVKMGFGISPLQPILNEQQKGGDDDSDD